ncbi:MAG: DinB family protein [Anaerolineales bacterium]
MAVLRAEGLIDDYKGNTWLIHRLVDGVTDAESVLQLPFEANCLNWVVGHIISRRNSSLACLGQPLIWSDEVIGKYKTGSRPIHSEADARPLSKLLADVDQAQSALEEALAAASESDLDEIVENDRGTKAAYEQIQGFHWHETYHIGQLEILRAFIDSQG